MEILPTVFKAVLVLFAVASVAHVFVSERDNYRFVWRVWKRIRFLAFMESLSVAMLTFTTVVLLWQIPGLNYGWTNLFFGEGGNIFIRPIMEGTESTNQLIRLMVPLYFIAFAFVLPFLAKIEEELFRKGHTKWKAIIKQSIAFGLVHCLVGVPLAAGIALAIPGLFYGIKYKYAFEHSVRTMPLKEAEDEAVMVSTVYHTIYNLIVVGLLIYITLIAI